MDFSFIIFIIIAWTTFSWIKGAGKGSAKAPNRGTAKQTLAEVHAAIRENATQTEFGARTKGPKEWNNEASRGQWGDMTPTQRGQERARQSESYPSSGQNSQQTLQQRLDAATKTMSSVRKLPLLKANEFKQGSERKVKRQEVGRGKDYGLSSRHAPQKDQNRHRRDDWGQRGGGEIISTKSLLVLLALGTIVIYVLSKVSPSDLGI